MNRSPTTVEVTGPGPWRGTIDVSAWPLDGSHPQVQVVLDDGRRLMVPFGLLQPRGGTGDGYRLPLSIGELDAAAATRSADADTAKSPAVVPVIEEELKVDKRTVESGGVRIRRVVTERERTIDEPLGREEVTVERVAIERFVEGPQQSRREGDVLIIPVVEEVLVVEKRLVLREEIRISKRWVEERRPQKVTLRRDEPIIERFGKRGDTAEPDAPRPPGPAGPEARPTATDGTSVARPSPEDP
jgi:uncharacterized protein (TIGR02271 family)